MRTAAPVSSSLRLLAAAAGLLAAAGPAAAAEPKVQVTAARVGLPPGRGIERDEYNGPVHVCKFAAWAPVYVDLHLNERVDGPAELVIESPDADEVATTLTVPLNFAGVNPGSNVSAWQVGPLAYVRPGSATGETTFTVRSAKGEPLSEPYRIRYLRTRDPVVYVVLSLGAKLPGFDLPKPSTAAGGGSQPQNSETSLPRNGKIELAAVTDADQLPDQWFGYDAVDLVVLATSAPGFLDRLFGDKGSAADKARRAALLEWVRRGGRVVVSVGSNATAVVPMTALTDLLPAALDPAAPAKAVSRLVFQWTPRESSTQAGFERQMALRTGEFSVATLRPKADRGRVVIPPPDRQSETATTVAVQGSYGLGRVTAVAFDLDRPPFTDFTDRAEFWDWVLREGGAARASVGNETRVRGAYASMSEEEDEVAAALRTHLDTFDGVPVISFGWVAVFIALYILLIGPVEYYVLKKVLGRLELTWVTFPIIVLTVSAAAYFTAYAVKGRDLKVNKVDVVDVVADFDPATGKPTGRVYGTSWFTLFSPRIDSYTIGVAPAAGWTANPTPGGTVVGWVGGPRSGRASLVRRRYAYHADGPALADGLENVPVQVWSTKSFGANWAADLDPAAPAIESRLEHPPGGRDAVVGTFVNRMPFARVDDCVAFYAGKAYRIGTILPNTEVRLVLDPGRAEPAAAVVQKEAQLGAVLARSTAGYEGSRSAGASRPPAGQAAAAGSQLPLWGVLFHEASLINQADVYPANASLRRLDQSWRLGEQNRGEVIVVGRAYSGTGPSRELFGPESAPTALWLRGLPKAGEAPPDVPGTARQETYVRLFLSVRTPGPGR